MKKCLFIVIIALILSISACSKSEKPKERKTKWVGEEVKEELESGLMPFELLYPSGEPKQLTILGQDMEVQFSTYDDFHTVSKYYQKTLPKQDWKKVIEGSYESAKESSLYFERGNREALINAYPGKDGKTVILVLWRLAM